VPLLQTHQVRRQAVQADAPVVPADALASGAQVRHHHLHVARGYRHDFDPSGNPSIGQDDRVGSKRFFDLA